MKGCAVDGCSRPAKCKGMCMTHYNRVRRTGATSAPQPRGSDRLRWLEENRLHTGDDCLIWPFGRTSRGYGNLSFGGKQTSASRVMCLLAHGQAPTDLHEAAHICGRGSGGCVNPTHLRWATCIENHGDAIEHGTHAGLANHGANHPGAKLDDEAVLKIRALATAGIPQVRICEQFGLSSSWVSRIVNMKVWTHL